MAVLMTTMRRSIFADRMSWLLMGCVALLVSGVTLNSGTTAFFTSTQELNNNSFTTATIALTSGATWTTLAVSKLVPGDVVSNTVTLTNNSTVSVPYYLSVVRGSTSAGSNVLDSDTTNGMRLAVFRCSDSTQSAPVSCASATHFWEVTGVTGGTGHIVTSSGQPTAAGITVDSSGNLVFSVAGNVTTVTGGTVAGKPILTANNSTCGGSGGKACSMGGFSSTTVSGSPAVSVTVDGTAVTVPAVSSTTNALGAAGTDNLVVYAYVPSAAGNTFQTLPQKFSFGFTAVQPSGTLNPSR
jgi:hypothetical protein